MGAKTLKSKEQLQAEAAYAARLCWEQEREQAKLRAERLTRDYSAGMLYVMPCACEVKQSERAEAGE